MAEQRLQLFQQEAAERRDAEEKLSQANNRLYAVIQASPLPIVAFDKNASITLWNQAAEQVFGWTEQEVLGKQLPYIPRHKQEEHQEIRRRVLEGERLTGLEIRRQRRDGSPIDLSLSSAPIKDSSSRLAGAMNILMDITQKKQGEDALRLANERLLSLNRELQEFTYLAHHDLQSRSVW